MGEKHRYHFEVDFETSEDLETLNAENLKIEILRAISSACGCNIIVGGAAAVLAKERREGRHAYV